MVAVSPSHPFGLEIDNIRIPRFDVGHMEGPGDVFASRNQMQMSSHEFRIGPLHDFLKESLSLDSIHERRHSMRLAGRP